MKLYFSPLTCSLATRIVLHELGLEAELAGVDRISKRMDDGGDYHDVHPLGLVPALRTDDGVLVCEVIGVMHYLAKLAPEAGLAPPDPQLYQWLSFIATELHRGIFRALFLPNASDALKAHGMQEGQSRLAYLNGHLEARDYVLEAFSICDAYLWTVLNWASATPIALGDYPALAAYHQRLGKRPAVARALREELPLYLAMNQAS